MGILFELFAYFLGGIAAIIVVGGIFLGIPHVQWVALPFAIGSAVIFTVTGGYKGGD